MNRDSIIFTEEGMQIVSDYMWLNTEITPVACTLINLLGLHGLESAQYICKEHKHKTFVINTTYGLEFEGADNQAVLVMGESGEHIWKRLDEIKIGNWMVVSRGANIFGDKIDIHYAGKDLGTSHSRHIAVTSILTPELAEWLGMLTAEGHLGSKNLVSFTQKDSAILDQFVALTNKLFPDVVLRRPRKTEVRFTSLEVRKFMENLGIVWGLSKTKTIPLAIKSAPKACVQKFMQAAIGLELHIHASGNKLDVEWISASRQMATEVQLMLLNFGIIAKNRLKRAKATNGKKIERDYWRLMIKGRTNLRLFRDLGFSYEPRKKKLIDNAELDKASTERDWIPNLSVITQGAIDEVNSKYPGRYRNSGRFRAVVGETLGRSIQTVASGRKGEKRFMTYHLLDSFIAKLNCLDIHGRNSDALRVLAQSRYSYTEVTQIISNEKITEDIYVLGANGFYCNGFFNKTPYNPS